MWTPRLYMDSQEFWAGNMHLLWVCLVSVLRPAALTSQHYIYHVLNAPNSEAYLKITRLDSLIYESCCNGWPNVYLELILDSCC